MLKTASVVFVDKNILEGNINVGPTLETLSKKLSSLGYIVRKVSIIEELDHGIVSELEGFSKYFDIVLIVTNHKFSSVSKAVATLFQDELVSNEKICKQLKINENISWPKLIKYYEGGNTIALYYQRMFIFNLDNFNEQLNLIQNRLQHYQKEKHLTKLFHLQKNAILLSFMPIPNLEVHCLENKAGISVKLDSKYLKSIVDGEIRVRSQVGSEIASCELVVEMEDNIWNSSELHIEFALEAITKCLNDYGPENTFLSFNGGKDCTVLLHLVQIAIRKKYPNLNHRLLCLYVKNDNTFKEQTDFIEQCKMYYNLEVVGITADIKTALTDILKKRPNLNACFMGTRRTDPYCAELRTFKMTDPDWPQVMRCNPILDWHYSDIWDYLLYYKVPYCELYDIGYTSLGSSLNTVPNPSLTYKIGDVVAYLPAYRLLKESQERDGRNASITSKM